MRALSNGSIPGSQATPVSRGGKIGSKVTIVPFQSIVRLFDERLWPARCLVFQRQLEHHHQRQFSRQGLVEFRLTEVCPAFSLRSQLLRGQKYVLRDRSLNRYAWTYFRSFQAKAC